MKFIYVISNSRSYKIGASKHPKKRLKELQTASDEKLELIYTFKSKFGIKLEKAIQRFLRSYIKNGEWFEIDIEKIKEICEKTHNNLLLLESKK